MQDLSVAEVFHEATKYSRSGLALQRRALDFSSQPASVKSYPRAEEIVLPDGPSSALGLVAEKGISLAALSGILQLTNGVTSALELSLPSTEPETLRLRAAPSAGGLYPTDLYLLAGPEAPIPEGVHYYDPQAHSLRHLRSRDPRGVVGESTRCESLFGSCQLSLAMTGVFERSAWRYGDRGYRRVLLDTGHVLGNLCAAAHIAGARAIPVAGFSDAFLAEVLGIGAGEEGPLVLVALSDGEQLPRRQRSLRSGSRRVGRPEGSLQSALHRSSSLAPGQFDAPCYEQSPGQEQSWRIDPERVIVSSEGVDWPSDRRLSRTILQRRSTRRYTAEGISFAQLSSLLAEAAEAPGLFAEQLLRSWVVVHAVEGLEPGIYELQGESLVEQRRGELRESMRDLCLGQELAQDCAALVIQSADLPTAVSHYGNRAYRYLHLDAGHIGQRLNLAAVEAGLGASGVGGFLDDELTEMLALDP